MFKKKVIKKEGKTPIKETIKEESFFKIDVGAEIPKLPDIEDKTKIDVKYPLIPPYCNAHIKWDAENNELIYIIEEPELTNREKKILEALEEGVKELINLSFISVKEKTTVVLYLEKNIKVLLNELSINITSETFLKLMYYIYRDFVGLNELEPLMNDYYIEDVECNGINTPIYVVHRKYRNIRTNLVYPTIEKLTSFVEKLAQKCGKYISYASPLLDGALPDGSRVQSVYTQEVASRGPSYTIRKFTRTPWSPIQLIQKGTASPEIYAYLWMLMEYERSLMVIGATGTGKTSFLNTMAFFIPPQARIVSIEDTKELQLEHENWLPSVARAGIGLATLTGQKMGEVTMFDLLKESFRQRPDYVIVGEIRGVEAFVLFQGMASGHPSMGTMHADSVPTMVKRLETQPINLSPALVETMDAVCVMIQTKIKGQEVRKVSQINEVIEVGEGGKVRINTPFMWDPRTNRFIFKTRSHVFTKIATHYGLTEEKIYNEFKLRTLLLTKLLQSNIVEFKQVQKIIHEYYKSPVGVLKRFKII